MSRYTKAQRHEFYKSVLDNFDYIKHNGLCEKMCYIVYGYCNCNNIDLIVEENFPELFKFKDNDKMYWLNTFIGWEYTTYQKEKNAEFRKLVLMFCIEMSARSVRDRAGVLSLRKTKGKDRKNAQRK